MWETLRQLFTDALSSAEGNQFLGAGLILGTITSSLLFMKSGGMWLLHRIRREITYSVYVDNSSSMYSAVSDWYYSKYPHKFKNVEFTTEWREVSGERNIFMKARQFNDFNMLWYKRRLLFIFKNKQIMSSSMSLETRAHDTYEIQGFFAKKAINHLVTEAYEYYKSEEQRVKGIKVVHHGSYDRELYRTVLTDYKTLDQVFCAEKDSVVADVEKFLSSREEYKRRGIRYKRNYLLSGPGGTGKTSLALAIAAWLNRRVYFMNPGKFSGDSAFETSFYLIEPGSIILFEDIDIFFTDREREADDRTTKVSFHALLNALDGANSPSDCLVFMTTNYPEKLDAALLRKGRVDYHAKIGFPSARQVEAFMTNFYNEFCFVGDFGGNLPMSAIQDICIQNDNPKDAIEQLHHGKIEVE
jgi:hypothetical protein